MWINKLDRNKGKTSFKLTLFLFSRKIHHSCAYPMSISKEEKRRKKRLFISKNLYSERASDGINVCILKKPFRAIYGHVSTIRNWLMLPDHKTIWIWSGFGPGDQTAFLWNWKRACSMEFMLLCQLKTDNGTPMLQCHQQLTYKRDLKSMSHIARLTVQLKMESDGWRRRSSGCQEL